MIEFCNYKWETAMPYGIIHTGQPWMWYDEECVSTSSRLPWDEGVIVHKGSDTTDNYAELTAEYKPKEIRHWDGNVYNPTVACGLLRSVETFGYGRFSAEIQLPRGRNLWPAFWLVGEDEWPKCGEIDIMEGWTNQFGGYFKMGIPQPPYFVQSWNTTTNIHWNDDYQEYWNYDGHKSCGSRRLPIILSLKRPAHNYIKYEVEWRPNIISFFANGHRVRTYGWEVAEHLLGKKMCVIFDLWTTQAQFSCDSPMKIRNFEYLPIDLL